MPADTHDQPPAAAEPAPRRSLALPAWRRMGDRRKGLTVAVVTLALACAVALFLAWFNWNRLRGPIARYASAKLERRVAIDGDLHVKLWSWTPRADVGGVRVAQPGWGPKGEMVQVGHAAVSVKLLPLLRGQAILPLVQVDNADVRLLREGSGRNNWTFGKPKPKGKPTKLPTFQNLVINNGRISYQDAQRDISFEGVVNSRERPGQPGAPGGFQLTGNGRFNREPFAAEVTGASLLNVTPSRPYPFRANVRAARTRLAASGQITRPFDLGRFRAQLSVQGDDLARLYGLTGLTLPNTPPYRIAGALERRGSVLTFNDFTGVVGDSDLSGDVSVETARERPLLKAELASKKLDFKDLGTLIGLPPANAASGVEIPPEQRARAAALRAQERLLPDAPLYVERLRTMDAEVTYRAASVEAPGLPLRAVSLGVKLDNALLTLNPVRFDFPQGRLEGNVAINGRRPGVFTTLDMRLSNVRVQDFLPASVDRSVALEGTLLARAKLSGPGDSVRKAAAAADGQVTVVAPRGEVRAAFAELAGVNVTKGLGLLLTGNDSQAPVNCGVVAARFTNGVGRLQTAVIDTGPTQINAEGTIDLRSERVSLELQGRPKSFRLVRARVPVTINGPFRSPKVGVQPGGAIAQAGIAVALGAVLSPVAAILPFVDTGLDKNANCSALLTRAGGGAAPVAGAKTAARTATKGG